VAKSRIVADKRTARPKKVWKTESDFAFLIAVADDAIIAIRIGRAFVSAFALICVFVAKLCVQLRMPRASCAPDTRDWKRRKTQAGETDFISVAEDSVGQSHF
jgi:hypothetical protein